MLGDPSLGNLPVSLPDEQKAFCGWGLFFGL